MPWPDGRLPVGAMNGDTTDGQRLVAETQEARTEVGLEVAKAFLARAANGVVTSWAQREVLSRPGGQYTTPNSSTVQSQFSSSLRAVMVRVFAEVISDEGIGMVRVKVASVLEMVVTR